MPYSKPTDPKEKLKIEFKISQEFLAAKEDTKHDLNARINGISCEAGSSGKQLAGYTTLQQFYRGDQWDHNEPAGASQRTDNYCAVIVDNLSSLLFDDQPEINCPTDDPTDEKKEIKAEMKEKLLWRVWNDNDYEVEFDEWSKQTSLYGDGFLKGPWMEKVDDKGRVISPEAKGKWKIRFMHIENPATVRLIFADSGYRNLIGYIHADTIPYSKAVSLYGDLAKAKGIKIEATINKDPATTPLTSNSQIPMVNVDEYWTDEFMAIFINDKILDYYVHDWGFVPLEFVKNGYIPNYPYGKSDLEDVLDPQVSHNVTNNDMANLLKWISSINLWGKNVEGMTALVAGLSRIYSLPDDGELHAFEKTGDPYITNTYVAQRRSAIIEISGVSEALMTSSQLSVSSGKAMALAFQGTIRKLNPRARRFKVALKHLNENILKLYEKYFEDTKKIIEGDYRNEVFLPTTLMRNVVDTINKFQSGIISQDTAMREAGVAQPNQEKKMMKKDLADPVLGPQVARQPALLPRLTEEQNQPGEMPMAAPGNAPVAGQAGAVANINNTAMAGAPTPK